jgi:hypothetical protein
MRWPFFFPCKAAILVDSLQPTGASDKVFGNLPLQPAPNRSFFKHVVHPEYRAAGAAKKVPLTLASELCINYFVYLLGCYSHSSS